MKLSECKIGMIVQDCITGSGKIGYIKGLTMNSLGQTVLVVKLSNDDKNEYHYHPANIEIYREEVEKSFKEEKLPTNCIKCKHHQVKNNNFNNQLILTCKWFNDDEHIVTSHYNNNSVTNKVTPPKRCPLKDKGSCTGHRVSIYLNE